MKKTLFALTILLLNSVLAQEAIDFKKSLIGSCATAGNSQTACECAVNGFEKNLPTETWEALLTSMNPKAMAELGTDKEKADQLLTLLNSAEAQIKKITDDCDASK